MLTIAQRACLGSQHVGCEGLGAEEKRSSGLPSPTVARSGHFDLTMLTRQSFRNADAILAECVSTELLLCTTRLQARLSQW